MRFGFVNRFRLLKRFAIRRFTGHLWNLQITNSFTYRQKEEYLHFVSLEEWFSRAVSRRVELSANWFWLHSNLLTIVVRSEVERKNVPDHCAGESFTFWHASFAVINCWVDGKAFSGPVGRLLIIFTKYLQFKFICYTLQLGL